MRSESTTPDPDNGKVEPTMDQAAPPQSKAKYNSEIEATITRADGTVESLGIIDAHYSNPLRQFVWLAFKRPASRRRIRAANRSAARKAA